MINVVIVEDHSTTRRGLEAILNENPKMQVIGFAENETEAMKIALEKHSEIDVVLMDISLKNDSNGLDICKKIKQYHPGINVLIFSSHLKYQVIQKAVQAKVNGYIGKDVDTPELYLAIETVAAGDEYFSQKVSKELRVGLVDKDVVVSDSKTASLTKREQEIAALMLKGKTSQEISNQLNISKTTVSTHRRNILAKTGCANTVELITKVQRNDFEL